MDILHEAPCSKTDGLHRGSRSKRKSQSCSQNCCWSSPLGHHPSQEAGDKPTVLPAANCKVFGAARCITEWLLSSPSSSSPPQLRSVAGTWKLVQALLCSSHSVLMAWVWFCHYTALTITVMGCSLFQLLKLILLQLLCQTGTRSVCGWGTGAGRSFGCFVAGRVVAGIPHSQVLGRTCSLVLVFSAGIPRLPCWVSLCQFLLLQLFLSPQPSALLPSPCGLCFLPSLHCVPEWRLIP